jgi:hypothetical protein
MQPWILQYLVTKNPSGLLVASSMKQEPDLPKQICNGVPVIQQVKPLLGDNVAPSWGFLMKRRITAYEAAMRPSEN